MSIYYTYLLKHIPTNTFYYGVRFAEGCHPEEFWKSYFTSSRKKIPQLREQYGDDSFAFEIRKTFDCRQKAIQWESTVLRRMKVLFKPNIWLNRTDNKAILNETSPTLGRVLTEEQKAKIRNRMIGNENGKNSRFIGGHFPWNKGKRVSEEQRLHLKKICENRVPWNKGKRGVLKHSEEWKLNHSKRLKGRKFSEEHKLNLSLSQKNKPRSYMKRDSSGKFMKKVCE